MSFNVITINMAADTEELLTIIMLISCYQLQSSPCSISHQFLAFDFVPNCLPVEQTLKAKPG